MSVKGRKNLARHLRHWREVASLSQRGLADVDGPSVATIVRIEAATAPDPSARTLAAIDAGLGLPAGTAAHALAGGDAMDAKPAPRVPTAAAAGDHGEHGVAGAGDGHGVFDDLARMSSRLRLRKTERVAVRDLMQTARLKEETLLPLASTPEVAASLNMLYRDSIAALATLVERSFGVEGRR